MKVKFLADHDLWLSEAKCQSFKKGGEYNLPKETAQKLIADKVAIETPTTTPKDK